ncbi:MAG: twin-arginine translocase subunit TatC [Muribaculaceae bacterium]|nr:twin-arginine translocase subunit TatC [Muribaculaceae bacterium]
MDSEKTFWAHLDDLRGVLFRIIGVYLAACIGLFAFMPRIFDKIILAPTRGDFPVYGFFERLAHSAPLLADESMSGTPAGSFSIELVNIELASQFFIHVSSTFWFALVLTLPVIIYLLWTFVRPGLYPKEREHATAAFVMGNVMFYLGAATGYFLVFPLTLRFLAGYQLSPLIPNVVSLSSYMDTFFTLLLLMGLVFELPLLAWIMGRTGLITREFFARYRRHAIVALIVLAAIITPTGDPLTLFVVFIPVYILWEFSAWLVKPNAKRQQNEEK